MSRGNRLLLCTLCLLLISIAALGDKAAYFLQYNRFSLLHGEIWRIFTAHLTHINRNHLLLNLVALISIFLLWGNLLTPRKWLAAITGCMLGISIGHLLFSPQLEWYRGFSGILHGLLVIGLLQEVRKGNRWSCIVLLALIVKLLVEQVLGPMAVTHQFMQAPIVPSAHLWGAMTGGLVAYTFYGAWRTTPPKSCAFETETAR